MSDSNRSGAERLSSVDRLVLAAANAWIYLSRPLFVAQYVERVRQVPNLATPGNISELINWRKLFDHDPYFVTVSDKLKAKDLIATLAPDLDVPETVWIGTRAEDIPAELIAPEFVIKTNHGYRFNYFPHRQSLPRPELNALLDGWAARPFRRGHQWAYRHIEPRIFVERRLVPGPGEQLIDLSFRCHDGRTSLSSAALDHKTPTSRSGYYWPDGRPLSIAPEHSRPLPADFALPPSYARAREIAERISRGRDYLRVDFLCAGDRLCFSEVTIYPASGYGEYLAEIEVIAHVWLKTLHLSHFLTTPQPWPTSVYAAALRRWLAARSAAEQPAETQQQTGGAA